MIASEGSCCRCGYKKLTASIPADIPYRINDDGLWEQCGEAKETGGKARIQCPKCGADYEGWACNVNETE